MLLNIWYSTPIMVTEISLRPIKQSLAWILVLIVFSVGRLNLILANSIEGISDVECIKVLEEDRESFSSERYEFVKLNTLDILQVFPPNHYSYVFIGSSLTPEAAFMRELSRLRSEIHSVNIPLSSPSQVLNQNDLDQAREQIISHFDKFLPQSFLSSEKTIVLGDITISGASLENAAIALAYYLSQKGFRNQISLFTYSSLFSEEYLSRWQRRAQLKTKIPLYIFKTFLGRDTWGQLWRQYGKFYFYPSLEEYVPPQGPLVGFARLRNLIREFIDQDTGIPSALLKVYSGNVTITSMDANTLIATLSPKANLAAIAVKDGVTLSREDLQKRFPNKPFREILPLLLQEGFELLK